jgi:hypothetical protein
VKGVFIFDSNRAIGIQHRDAGNVYNAEFRDIMIEGTSFGPMNWWGASEPMWITSVVRVVGAPVGRIFNITFINITAHRCENGAFFSSRTPTPINGIVLDNVHINIASWRPQRQGIVYTQPEHDYRPSGIPPQVVPFNVDGLYFEQVNNVRVSQSSVSFAMPRMSWWGKCVGGKVNITKGDLSCVNG